MMPGMVLWILIHVRSTYLTYIAEGQYVSWSKYQSVLHCFAVIVHGKRLRYPPFLLGHNKEVPAFLQRNAIKCVRGSIFWDITPLSPLKVNRRYRKICRLHLYGRKVSRPRNQLDFRWQAKFCYRARFLPGLFCLQRRSVVNMQNELYQTRYYTEVLGFWCCFSRRNQNSSQCLFQFCSYFL
jgi:hypothetical protein